MAGGRVNYNLTNRFPYIYRGEVLDNEDSTNLGKCKIRVFGVHGKIDNKDVLPWARPVVLSPVNDKKGSINIPDVGDIVWVLFEGGDKEYPVYFGGTYGDSDIEVDKNITCIYVDDGNRVVYNKETNTYTFNANSNYINLTPEGIELVGAIRIKGDIDIEGTINTVSKVSVTPLEGVTGAESEGPPEHIGEGSIEGATSEYEEGSWLYCVQSVKEILANMGVSYSQVDMVTYEFKDFKETVHPDCSGTVTAMLALYYNKKMSQISSTSFTDYSSLEGFTKHEWTGWDSLNTGDIIALHGHVEVFAYNEGGKHYVWNAGSTSSINSATPTKSGHSSYSIYWRCDKESPLKEV